MQDNLGDRMKSYEANGVGEQRLLPRIPVLARLDGRAFHTFTRNLTRPYEQGLSDLMVNTTKFLVDESNALVGYTQSDEISLVWLVEGNEEMYFDGRIFKVVSNLAAKCSVYFNANLAAFVPKKAAWSAGHNAPVFDCRVWNVPTKQEAVNSLIWRQNDASRNSISMLAQTYFTHVQLQGKSCEEMQEMVWQEKKINWNDCPAFFKRGTFVRRKRISTPFTVQDIEALPPKHEARKNPDLVIERSVIAIEDWPQLTKIANREDVIFSGADPILTKD